jgi:hypothetical protein
MPTIRPKHLVFLILACTTGMMVDHTFAEDTLVEPVALAIVGEDTLTTTELKIQLALMNNRNVEGAPTPSLDPAMVLRRLTQNQLIIQEGYRMGLNEEFIVANQVLEVVRHECMAALLDSVAYSVPKETPDYFEARRLAVKNYIEDLQEKYEATVDSTLLATLDYGSDDQEMQAYLNESQDILAVVPTGKLSVAAFSRIVKFTEFHGLVGKPDAADKRDKVFHEWFAEALLNFQYLAQGMDKDPEMVMLSERWERNLVLEETLGILLQTDFTLSETEIEEYYRSHLEAVTPAPKVKMKSLKVADEAAALAIYDKLLRGTPANWLYSNDPSVVQGPPPFPEEFFRPNQLGLKPENLVVGYIPPPYQVPTGWVVAIISEIENPAPTPLASCRPQIENMMRSEMTEQLMVEILEKLEEVSPVVILPGAETTVLAVIDDFKAKSGAALVGPTQNPNGEG